ncbi:4'-phosphopantetheinyl transferase superfamily protein, partial [Mesorhizobium sp.]|uniref:4'-phosphopantetheinyl transferase family protein n=1 Tax=Mesorhizobium sp. TaxID=1871066 RepID=UPI00257EC90B
GNGGRFLIWRHISQLHKADISCLDVFLIDTGLGAFDTSILSAEERTRARQQDSPDLARRFVAGRWCLRLVLAWKTGIVANELQITPDKLGKPKLPKHYGLEFNLSHSGCYALIATNDSESIGVDIQKATLDVPSGVEEAVFTPRERRDLRHAESYSLAFYTGWARKEA